MHANRARPCMHTYYYVLDHNMRTKARPRHGVRAYPSYSTRSIISVADLSITSATLNYYGSEMLLFVLKKMRQNICHV
jgi:hypothetical protein